MNRAHRLALHASFTILAASGVAAELAPAWRSALMRVHGAAAMVALLAIGGLLVQHVTKGWAERRNRCTGAIVLAGALWLAMTGYVLYYSGSDELRAFAGSTHLWIGIALAVALGLHIRRAALT